jgi:hypothetical protein
MKVLRRILLVTAILGLLTTCASAGSFYLLSCEASHPEDNTYEYGSDYHIIMENEPIGGTGTYFVEIYTTSWFASPGLKSVGRWWMPSFIWHLRWVPSYPSEEPPFDEFGTTTVVINHDAGYGILEGTGAGVWTSGWGYSNSLAMQTSLGTFLDITYEWKEPYSGDYSQNSAWLLNVPNITVPGYFQYDEVADDGSWIGYCTALFQSYYVCATTDSYDEGDGAAVPQVYGSMNILTVAGQELSSSTGGSTGGTSTSSSGGTLGGGDGGAASASESPANGSAVFPIAFMVAVGATAVVSGKRRRS